MDMACERSTGWKAPELPGSGATEWDRGVGLDPQPVPVAPRGARTESLSATIAAVAGGDHKAFERFYEATVARVYALARRICVDPALAEEVTEDVFVQAWREASRFDASRGAPIAWLLVMARTRALDARRRLDPALTHPEPQSLLDASSPAGEAAAEDPLDLLEALRRESRTRAALATLPAGDRQMVALAFLRGLTHAEIAAVTRLPLGTVKTAIRRALLALRECLPDYAPARHDESRGRR
jgi:RNA polymerase sigma-70 factor (ECF subfamily)